ncbi:DUF86 domain-containing protein [Amycolatopsis lurida]
MRREPGAYLWDVLRSAQNIADFSQERSFSDYQNDVLLKSGVERQFEIIGEALNQLSKVAPQVAAGIPGLPRIVAFRNILIHGYAILDDLTVWEAIDGQLPSLVVSVQRLLDQIEDKPGS